eukprot:2976153-Rhodomonas_salina.1
MGDSVCTFGLGGSRDHVSIAHCPYAALSAPLRPLGLPPPPPMTQTRCPPTTARCCLSCIHSSCEIS